MQGSYYDNLISETSLYGQFDGVAPTIEQLAQPVYGENPYSLGRTSTRQGSTMGANPTFSADLAAW